MVRRTAFTLIELIFAIVVIGIAVVSLPVMTQTTDRGLEGNVIQEGIFASATAINEAMANYWDINSQYDANISGGLSRVIETANSNCNTGFPNRSTGHVNRRCLSDLTIGVANDITAASTLDNLEQVWNNTNIILNNDASTAYATYKSGYYATADVTDCSAGGCIQFGNIANNSSLKEIAFTIKNSDGDTIVLLRAYSANIGDTDIVKKVLP